MRKLAIACLGFAGAVFACQYLLPGGACFYCAAGALLLAGGAALFLKNAARLGAALALFGLCAGFLVNGLFLQAVYFPAAALSGKTGTLTATAASFPERTQYGSRVTVRVDAGGVGSVKTALYVYDSQGDLSALRPGDVITVTAEMSLADTIRGEETDYYSSRGIFLIARARSEAAVTPRERVPLRYLPTAASRLVREKLAEIYPEKYLGFMQAILTGDRTLINGDPALTTRLSTAGLSHVVAVSGMHVSFLVGFLGLIVKNRRRFAVIAIPVLAFFAMMVGGAPSVVRACFMQALLLIAPAVRRESDSLTSLSAVLAVLLLINPFSARNAGLQLSFAATAGIVLISGRLCRRLLETRAARFLESRLPRLKLSGGSGRNRAVYFVCASLSTSIGALAFTCPLSALYFDYVSLIAPLTNLLCLWAVTAVFVIGIFTVLLGFLWLPLAVGVSFAVRGLLAYLFGVVRLLSRIPYAAVYTDNRYVAFWLLFLYAALILWIFLKDAKKPRFTPLALIICALALSLGLGRADALSADLTAAFLDVGQGACSVLTGGGGTVVVDCGGVSGAGTGCAGYISSLGERNIDYLILTHFHSDHSNGAEALLSSVKTRFVVAPRPEKGDEGAAEILSAAEESGAKVIFAEEPLRLSTGSLSITVYPPVSDTTENESGISCLVSDGGFDVLYTGDMSFSGESSLLSAYALPDIEVLAVGHHGSKYSTSEELLRAVRPETAVISVGYNTYGHPTDETLERLSAAGAEVYRTDLAGRVVIRYNAD